MNTTTLDAIEPASPATPASTQPFDLRDGVYLAAFSKLGRAAEYKNADHRSDTTLQLSALASLAVLHTWSHPIPAPLRAVARQAYEALNQIIPDLARAIPGNSPARTPGTSTTLYQAIHTAAQQ